MATQSCRRNEPQRSFERIFSGFTDESSEQATHSAGQSGIGDKRARYIATPSHRGALIAAKHIQATIQDAVVAGLLPKQPLETRLAAIIETATSTYLETLDGEDEGTANPYVQKAAQAADEAWQQTVDGHNGPIAANPTVSDLDNPSSASQDERETPWTEVVG